MLASDVMINSEQKFAADFDFISFLEKEISVSINSASFERVLDSLEKLEHNKARDLIVLCNGILSDDARVKQKLIRIAAVRTLVALMPNSWPSIESWLRIRPDAIHYEIQFSFFCYLDWVAEMPVAGGLSKEVIGALANYLKNVRYDTAQAGWMAGDLLGDHWEPEEAWPILSTVVREAKYVVGRKSALHGIEKLLSKSIANSMKKDILRSLHEVAKTDSSSKLRWEAKMMRQEIHLIE